jgi:hypothetical protein
MNGWLPKKIYWTQKFGTLEIALTIIGAVLYGLGAFSTMNLAIGFITLRPFAFIAVVWGVFFGPWVGGIAALIGNTFISDILAGWFGIGGVGGAVGNFMMAFIPGLLVAHPKNWHHWDAGGGLLRRRLDRFDGLCTLLDPFQHGPDRRCTAQPDHRSDYLHLAVRSGAGSRPVLARSHRRGGGSSRGHNIAACEEAGEPGATRLLQLETGPTWGR